MSTLYGRRSFLRAAGLLSAGLTLPSAFAAEAEPARARRLICIFLRGAADGLSLVVPYAEAAYYRERPSIAIAPPGKAGGVIDLDGRFGLHPRLAPLKPLFDQGSLALVHAVGSPHPTRSHFEAQDYMETADVGVRSNQGWLARCLERSGPHELRAIALTDTPPLALRGAPALVAPRLEKFRLKANERVRERLERGFARMYAGARAVPGPALGDTGVRALDMARRLAALPLGAEAGDGGGQYPKQAAALRELAVLIRENVPFDVAWLDAQGWDTHQNQGNADKGRLAPLLDAWARGLLAFWNDLGERREQVVVLVMTEFGRTLKENGTGGTDHGHGSVMFALGGRVRGGRVYGRWPGLELEQRWEGRDLAVTTDFRTVFAELAKKQLAVPDVTTLIPGAAAEELGLLA
jgi:uncharacterized protein (DUF1501 family)